MLINKRRKVALVAIIVLSMVAMYGFMPMAKAASLVSAKDTLSDSAPEAVATHTIEFQMGTALTETQYVKVIFATEFDTSNATGTCPINTTLSTTTSEVRCTVNAGATLASTSVQTILAIGIVNPSVENYYDVTISTHQFGGDEIEASNIKVYIISAVSVSATVPATLSFGVTGMDPASSTTSLIPVTATSTAATLPFGDLVVNTASTLGHRLSVTTNAASGYVVTLEQDGELRNAAGATINSFNNSEDGSGSTTPQVWDDPHGTLDADHTYGHMGVATSTANYIGLNGAAQFSIMSHSGPADGTTEGVGAADVLYTVKITALQEAGDYNAELTYICTPTY